MARTAVVTGASSGIGAATARRLAASGYEVVVLARREELLTGLAEEIGGRALTVDITDAAAVAAAAATLDGCDVLVNNAGGALGADPVAGADPGHWQWMFDVNVLGTLKVTQALLPLLRAGDGGTIVTITSTAAFVNYEGGAGYSAAKHAEHALTETLRLELSGEPVRVIEIAPGMVRTDEFAVNRFEGDAAKAAAVYADVDRPLTAEDVAECVALAVGLPQHVNVDQLVVRPLAQAAQHKIHRGRLFQG
ncbi:oxidoreductase [Streptomyces eurocidicus]|uniref:NADP-dependent 3-hydroxy acid dehydrogenase YdfG n=1 Tax=Streptomyces eurocidicus TaxID=66423 RepID=A0A2N8NXN8_STREU|nr:SDR family oxidoreductase [Streptomyces eurocidicus]MBB5120592.1 NADP-dependent 3-hydroxy acid dehydrogenase YdfG [Streptomyces eurocidicus]MBF6053800.1 SDR family NAD(P)-dependent oxidoreductase [Streptomyces eurocidicus]PNE33526.1 oxidoreductase [Streptomyces eurocidicus]